MTPGVTVTRCSDCGWVGFPERLWCPACGSDRVSPEVVHEGQLVAATTLRRAVGGLAADVEIGRILLPGGGNLIARLAPGAEVGECVQLHTDRGAPVARG